MGACAHVVYYSIMHSLRYIINNLIKGSTGQCINLWQCFLYYLFSRTLTPITISDVIPIFISIRIQTPPIPIPDNFHSMTHVNGAGGEVQRVTLDRSSRKFPAIRDTGCGMRDFRLKLNSKSYSLLPAKWCKSLFNICNSREMTCQKKLCLFRNIPLKKSSLDGNNSISHRKTVAQIYEIIKRL